MSHFANSGRCSVEEKKVLIIDDQADAADSFAMILRHQGYLPVTAISGAAGLTKALEIVPDAIVLDLMMPDLNGWDFLRRKGLDPAIAAIPVIIITGYADVEEIQAGSQPVVVLRKPAVPDDLLTKIKELTA